MVIKLNNRDLGTSPHFPISTFDSVITNTIRVHKTDTMASFRNSSFLRVPWKLPNDVTELPWTITMKLMTRRGDQAVNISNFGSVGLGSSLP